MLTSNSPNAEWGKHIVELTLMQWDYVAVHRVEVGGNCGGFDVLEAALDVFLGDLCEKADKINALLSVTLLKPNGDSLIVDDEEDREEEWLKRMIVAIKIVNYIPPTLNEVRRSHGKPPLADGDRPWEP